MPLIQENKFTLPLYHGTTSRFINSIKKLGLGGKNPLEDIGLISLFREVFDHADKVLVNDHHWEKFRDKFQNYAEQNIVQGIFNFRHGDTYLTLNRELAEKYAMECPCGSEILTQFKSLLQMLKAKRVEGLNNIVPVAVLDSLEAPYDPYVIELNEVSINEVQAEVGQGFEEQIANMDALLQQGIVSPSAFVLTHPISQERLSIKRLGEYQKLDEEWLLTMI